MPKFSCAQDGHVVPIIPPQDVHGGVTSLWFNLKNAAQVSIILNLGAAGLGADGTVTLEAATDATGDNPVAIAFDVYKCESKNSDVLGPRVAVTSAGFTPAGVADSFYVIEITAAAAFDALGTNYAYLALVIASGGTSPVLGCANAILNSQRFAADQGATVLT